LAGKPLLSSRLFADGKTDTEQVGCDPPEADPALHIIAIQQVFTLPSAFLRVIAANPKEQATGQ